MSEGMKVLQYSYFALKSETVPATVITERLGMAPDETMVLGSRFPEHRVPRCHAWEVVRRSQETPDEQIEHVVGRLTPVRAQLVALTAELDVTATMVVVRYRHHDDGVTRSLGWYLSPEVLAFLSDVRAGLDVDEYDLSEE